MQSNVKLIQARKDAGYTQEAMAKMLKMTTNTYYLKETGKRDFTLLESKIILTILKKRFEEIFN